MKLSSNNAVNIGKTVLFETVKMAINNPKITAPLAIGTAVATGYTSTALSLGLTAMGWLPSIATTTLSYAPHTLLTLAGTTVSLRVGALAAGYLGATNVEPRLTMAANASATLLTTAATLTKKSVDGVTALTHVSDTSIKSLTHSRFFSSSPIADHAEDQAAIKAIVAKP